MKDEKGREKAKGRMKKILSILFNQENHGSENDNLIKAIILNFYFINSIFPIFVNPFDSNL